jgi:hypothetical protein
MRSPMLLLIGILLCGFTVVIPAVRDALPSQPGTEHPIHIFAFDDDTIPYKDNLKLTLVSPEKYPGNPILSPGPEGSVDAIRAQFYGSVIRVGQKFRMWYSAISDTSVAGSVSQSARIAYAESSDGIHWVKPELGPGTLRIGRKSGRSPSNAMGTGRLAKAWKKPTNRRGFGTGAMYCSGFMACGMEPRSTANSAWTSDF